jgi:hypothetical protein
MLQEERRFIYLKAVGVPYRLDEKVIASTTEAALGKLIFSN